MPEPLPGFLLYTMVALKCQSQSKMKTQLRKTPHNKSLRTTTNRKTRLQNKNTTAKRKNINAKTTCDSSGEKNLSSFCFHSSLHVFNPHKQLVYCSWVDQRRPLYGPEFVTEFTFYTLPVTMKWMRRTLTIIMKFFTFVMSKDLTLTWFEHATFWSGVRRATVAPQSHCAKFTQWLQL